jgi:hypothetical protein
VRAHAPFDAPHTCGTGADTASPTPLHLFSPTPPHLSLCGFALGLGTQYPKLFGTSRIPLPMRDKTGTAPIPLLSLSPHRSLPHRSLALSLYNDGEGEGRGGDWYRTDPLLSLSPASAPALSLSIILPRHAGQPAAV